ncbi:MAG: hypothetical protein QM710_03105 [Flavobacterium sp.]
MRNFALYTIVFTGIVSVSCFAQSNDRLVNSFKVNDTQSASDMADSDMAIVSYHVEERINMNFGSRITTYDVPNLDMVSTKDLGENNTRKVTPKYGKVRAKIDALAFFSSAKPQSLTSIDNISVTPINTDVLATTERKRQFADIDVIATYERVMDKGYKSVAMMTKVADRHFFEGDLVLAAKWYNELFSNTTDLEAVYYYRYAESLKATNQLDKAKEMMKIFESKSL